MLLINLLCAFLFLGLLFYGDFLLFTLVYLAVYVFAVARAAMQKSTVRVKLSLFVSYGMVFLLQMVANVIIVFGYSDSSADMFFRRFFGILILLIPLVVSRYVSVGKYARLYLPSIQDIATISFSELNDYKERISSVALELDKVNKCLSKDNLFEVITDLPRHSSFKYINNGSLTDEYFGAAEETLFDPYVYIVISNTGSAASDIISVFTRKQFNHASLSFDRDLKTIVSYNGGERVYLPGLNHEIVEFYSKKADASIIIYRLPCTYEQKKVLLDKVREINKNGSAYNILGLVIKYSHKPNIMFCSQFVYQMLSLAGLAYFDVKDGMIKPTDFIELDYYRKLEFAYEIVLGDLTGVEGDVD